LQPRGRPNTRPVRRASPPDERDRARKQATKADRLNAFLQNILGFSDPTWLSANPKRNREATIADALDEAGRRAAIELADEPEVLAAVHFTIGWTYKAQAKFAAAEPHLRASLEIRQRVLGRDHPETAQSLVGIGEFHHYKGEFAEAKGSYAEAVDVYRKAKQAGTTVDAMWFAIALNNLGTAELGLGKLKEAEPVFTEGLEIGRDFTGNKRAPVAVMLSNLGLVRREQGDLAGAIHFMERGLQEYRALPGEPRFEMGAAMFNLATTLTWMGELDRAEVLAREAFDIIRNGVGEKHPYTPRPLIALSTIHLRRGDYAKAREEIDRAIQLQLAGIPEGHLDFATSWIVLGKILTRAGDPAGSRIPSASRIGSAARALCLPATT
jgi:tetratricopeptide (TPR) repeat protein